MNKDINSKSNLQPEFSTNEETTYEETTYEKYMDTCYYSWFLQFFFVLYRDWSGAKDMQNPQHDTHRRTIDVRNTLYETLVDEQTKIHWAADILNVLNGRGRYGSYDYLPQSLMQQKKLISFCNDLVKIGYVHPILDVVFHLNNISSDMRNRFLYIIGDCKETLPNGQTLDSLCKDYLKWLKEGYYDSFEPSKTPTHYIGQAIIGCYPEVSAFEWSHLATNADLEKFKEFYENHLKDQDPLKTLSWLVPVACDDSSCHIELLHEYIFPALKSLKVSELDAPHRAILDTLIRRVTEALSTIFIFTPLFCSFIDLGIKHDNISCLRNPNLKLSDFFHSHLNIDAQKRPVSKLGNDLYEFLNSADLQWNKTKETEERARLLNFRDANPAYLTSTNDMMLLAAFCLFLDDEEEKGTDAILQFSYAKGRHESIELVEIDYALFGAFYRCKDYNQKMRLYTTIKAEQARRIRLKSSDMKSSDIFPDEVMDTIDEDMFQAMVNEVKKHIDKIANIKNSSDLSDDGEKLKEIENINELVVSMSSMFFAGKRAAYARELERSAATFLDQHPLDRDLYGSLTDAVKRRIQNCLLESGVLFELKSMIHEESGDDDQDQDYSSVILPMTKALELLGNLIFRGAVKNADSSSLPRNVKQTLKFFLDKEGHWSDSLALGNVSFMFKLDEFVSVANDSDSAASLSAEFVSAANNSDNDSLPKLFNVIDEDRLRRLDGVDLGLRNLPLDKNGENVIDAIFTNDSANNRKVLSVILQYIAENFRNKCAHKDKIGFNQYEECRDLLVTGKHLIWILLYLLKDDIRLGEEPLPANSDNNESQPKT